MRNWELIKEKLNEGDGEEWKKFGRWQIPQANTTQLEIGMSIGPNNDSTE